MTTINSSQERNVEHIRQKNLEDNRLFLEKLLMNNIRKDFLHSARSIIRANESDRIKKHVPHSYQKVERTTRYNEKLKSGEIAPHVPEWQRKIERKELEKQQKEQEIKLRRQKKEKETKLRRQKKTELRRQKKEMGRQEELFEKLLKKIESQLKFEEEIKIRRAKRNRSLGSSKFELSYQQPYKLRHMKCDK